MLRVLDLFSGIGGFSLGLERTGGFKTIGFCEKDKFCQQVLAKHWQGVPIIEDIHDVSRKSLYEQGITGIDVLSAGFPCQPFSAAGEQKGLSDERFLWQELFRVIADIKPSYVILENVPRLRNFNNGLIFAGILYDLAQIGYDAEWQVLSAASFGAWHRRERLWIVAYPSSERQGSNKKFCPKCTKQRATNNSLVRVRSIIPHTNSKRLARGRKGCCVRDETKKWRNGRVFPGVLPDFSTPSNSENHVFESPIFKDADGVSRWVVEPVIKKRHRQQIRAIGNAVVPQIPQFIGECILQREAV